MTFKSFPVSSIWVDRAQRQRRDLGDLTDLKESITAIGLINPIIITREGELKAGERRFESVKALGWTHVPVQFREDLTDHEWERLELDENIKRKDLTWQERARAIERYCNLSRAGGLTIDQAAERLGFVPLVVYRNLSVAKVLDTDPRVAEAPKFSAALGIVQRTEQRRKASSEEKLATVIHPVGEAVSPVEEPTPTIEPDAPPILHADFIEWMGTYKGPRFNLLHCDFPYGINAGKHDQGAAGSFGGYEDTPKDYEDLVSALYDFKALADSAHLIFWFPTKSYSSVFKDLTDLGWTVNPIPLIWHRFDNSGIIPDPRRMPRQVYESAFLCSRGDRFLVQARSNLFASPNVKQWHMSEKPLPVLEYFLSMLVDDTTVMLDPTCGSGNALIAANRLGAREVLGIEKNDEFYKNACDNWKENGDE